MSKPGTVRVPVLEHGRDSVRLHHPINHFHRVPKGFAFRTEDSLDFVRDSLGPVSFAPRGANAD